MENSIADLVRCEVFEQIVNISLFNDIIEFVLLVSDMQLSEKNEIRSELADRVIWYNETSGTDFQEKYNFRYFGELLERYEERFGSNERDLRTIALALAYSQPMLSANMFVGPQQKDFIKKVRDFAGNDVYLNGALYLIDMAQKGQSVWLTEREVKPFGKTEELLFFLSLYPQIEIGYTQMKAELIRLLGADRTIPVIHNIGLYCWLIRRLYSTIKEDRKKDASLFKALAALPASFVKEDSPQFKTLLSTGYTPLEIVYANYVIPLYAYVPNRVDPHGMVTEKIAVSLCKTIISDPNPHAEDTYGLLHTTLSRFETFPIKCYGFKKILSAIEVDTKCECPQTFIKLSQMVKNSKLFTFDILDGKWDVLAAELPNDRYRDFFDSQILADYRTGTLTKKKVQARMDVFERLTGISYIQTFDEEISYRPDEFSMLVKSKAVALQDLFEMCLWKSYGKIMADSIWRFIEGVQSQEAFEFFRWLFSQYEQEKISEIFDSYSLRFNNELYDGRRAYSYWNNSRKALSVQRKFLTPEENRLIVDWLDTWVYLNKTSDYIDFVICVLTDEFVSSLFTQEELRSLYITIMNNKPSALDSRETQLLKEKFLTEAELQAEAEAEKAKALEQERLNKEKQIKAIHGKFEELFDGTYGSVIKFLKEYRYSYRSGEQQTAHQLVSDSFDQIHKKAGSALTKEELSCFFKICNVLTNTGALRLPRIKTYLETMEEEEEAA